MPVEKRGVVDHALFFEKFDNSFRGQADSGGYKRTMAGLSSGHYLLQGNNPNMSGSNFYIKPAMSTVYPLAYNYIPQFL